MISDELGKQLHDRATRGESVSEEEQGQLDVWYAAQDRTEMEALDLTAATEAVELLQAQVDSVLVQLGTVTKRIQEIAEENQVLRKEIAMFRCQLAQQMVTQWV